ncbi:MAG: aminotransferase class I/II-fold pyridoxal phosphate-dependent enzyme [Gemmatimonadota bacterium]
MTIRRHFASDNYAGVHPAVLQAIADANVGHASSYGADPWTAQATDLIRREFGPRAEPFFVFNGTGANVVALSAILQPWQAVLCPAGAHINVDECGSPERFTGCKLLTVPTTDGKLRPDDMTAALARIGDEHSVQLRAISISQTTEYGTAYSATEVRALADHAHRHHLLLHMDGARLANAAVGLGATLAELTADAGVDILSFGGTKNGLLGAEAVILFTVDPASLKFLRKQAAQLASKMRFLSAQFIALLTDRLWHTNASHANRMAARLAAGLARFPRLNLTQPVDANSVFAQVPAEYISALQERYRFYLWDQPKSEVRLMCAWDTTEADVDGLLAAMAEIVR